jgi:hypothetical protein
MKSTLFVPAVTFATLGSFLLTGGSFVGAQDASAGKPAVSGEALSKVAAGTSEGTVATAGTGGTGAKGIEAETFPGKTILDDPRTNDPRLTVPIDAEGKVVSPRLSKIDLDGDFNYDGTINNEDPTNQGRLEYVPPGLEVGVGEVTRLVIRLKTYEVEFPGNLEVTLEVTGINRDSASGSFPAGSSGQVGRIKVWRDQAKSELLLDSGDSGKISKTWVYEKGKLAGGIPRTVYVEGAEASGKSEGDIRLMAVAAHRPDGAAQGSNSTLYQSAFDHMLLTVRKAPVPKEFVNNNAEGVWSSGKAPEAAKPAEAAGSPAAPR